jgi:SAM-dependent methyltransferase
MSKPMMEHETTLPGEGSFVTVAPLYDELMDGVPYESWVVYLRTLLERRNRSPQRVLDVACGTGNVTQLLAVLGYQMTGVDIAPDMIAAARQKAEAKNFRIDYFVQDAAELDLPQHDFDLCVSLFDSLNYIINPERLATAIQRIGQHLRTGALFIFDMNSEYALIHNFFRQENLASRDRLRYDWDSTYDPKTRLCRVEMKFWYREDSGLDRTFEEIHYQFAYKEEEVRGMLTQAGFGAIETFQAYTLRTPSRNSDRIFYVAEKQVSSF